MHNKPKIQEKHSDIGEPQKSEPVVMDWPSYFQQMGLKKLQQAQSVHASFYIDSLISGKASPLDAEQAMLALSRVQTEEIPMPPCESLNYAFPHPQQVRDIMITYITDNTSKISEEARKLIIKLIRFDVVEVEDIEFAKELLLMLIEAQNKKEPLVFFDPEILDKYLAVYNSRSDLIRHSPN